MATTEITETPTKRRGRKLCVGCNKNARASSRDSDERADNLCVDCTLADLEANRCPNGHGLNTKTHRENCRLAPGGAV